ncbi:MAG TPA: cytochrome C oxidase subunit IV family protein [Gemmataceae bacterium]|jgi:cytochrome c oxidase subunit 4|nr:cytochrome C oxidase subunit IV family protein [Gemmataceae bacterium]
MNKHITSETTYYVIFAALIALTLLTVGLSFVHLGETMHLVVGLTIATTKAVLVVLFFMHLLYSPRLSWIMFLSGLFWLGILLVLTLTDYLSRGVLNY